MAILAAAAVVVGAGAVAWAQLAEKFAGPQGDGTSITPTGLRVTPVGSQEKLGERPYGMALSPDGEQILIANDGVYKQSVMLIDANTGTVTDTIPYFTPEGVSFGVAWAPDGERAYVSAAPNDKVRVFDVAGGSLEETDPFELDNEDVWPTGLAVSEDGAKLYVAENVGNALTIIDTATGEQSRVLISDRVCPVLKVGFDSSRGKRCNFAYGVTLSHDGGTAYVTNWGKRSVAVVDTASEEHLDNIAVGTHPSAMALSPTGEDLYVANSDSDTVSVVDTATNEATRSFSMRPYPGAPDGASPNALAVAPDGETLYVANAGNNDVAVVRLAGEDRLADEVAGLIPTAWYPTGVAVANDGSNLYVANAKGLGAGPNPRGPDPTKNPESTPGQYIGSMIDGTLSTIGVPDEEQLAAYTEQVVDNNQFDKRYGNSADVLENIEHVIYIVKENRTYDQVLGDLPRGNGDPSLTLFDYRSAPNHHKLARQFVTLDNLYAAGEVSTDGWEWSTAANASTFTQKSWPTLYGGRGYFYTAEGTSLANSPSRNPENAYIWDALSKAGLSFRNYGFWTTSEAPVEVYNEPNLARNTDREFPGYNLSIRDQVRYRIWLEEFRRYKASGEMPAAQFVRFSNDHTCGTDPACPTPQAMMADNDWAMGKLIDKVSHSEFWDSTAIFVIEDDAQDGPDHVDAHRTVGYVVSPYTQTSEVDSTFYSSASMLRTMEMVFGLAPLTYFDATASPLLNSFTDEPDFGAYNAVKPAQPLGEMNQPEAPMARASSRMDFSREDIAPWHTLNRAIWKGVKGAGSKMPAPQHNLSIEEEEEEE